LRQIGPIGAVQIFRTMMPDQVEPSFVVFDIRHSDAQGWVSECPDVKNYKWRLNPVWHRMLYSITHMAKVKVKGLSYLKRTIIVNYS